MVSFDTQALYMWKASVDSGSFKNAAELCGCNPSTISKNIASLERALGKRLRYGSKNRMYLTEAGKDWYTMAERFIADVENIGKGEDAAIKWEYETVSSMRRMNDGQREEIIRMIRRIAC